jgi:D-3-phosphoglycerate dehydrogenase
MSHRPRVLITAVPFGLVDRHPLDLLEREDIPYQLNPVGRRLREEELMELAHGVTALVAGTEPITERVMAAVPSVRLISRVGIGLDSVDLLAARSKGVQVCYTPDAPAPAVAELTVGLMLALLRDVGAADRLVRGGGWHRFMGRRLHAQTVGIVGVGRIGRRVARMLRGGFPSVRILAHDLQPDEAFGREQGMEWVDMPTLLRESDVITVHVPLTRLTSRMIDEPELALLKPTAVLINTARGGIVAEDALARALSEGRLGAAALDVFEVEPYEGALRSEERCLLTCHMGSMTDDCRARMELESVQDVLRFFRGDPVERPVPEDEYRLRMIDGLAAPRRLP